MSWGIFGLLFFSIIGIPIGLLLLIFPRKRRYGKWLTLGSLLGIVTFFGLFLVFEDDLAKEDGFLDKNDRHAARVQGYLSAKNWKPVRDKLAEDAAKARERAAEEARLAAEDVAKAKVRAAEEARLADEDRRAQEIVKRRAAEDAAKASAQAAKEARIADGNRSREEIASMISPANYSRCAENFSSCKGKFIRFEGEVEHIGGGAGQGPTNPNLVRISTSFHGFDVEMIDRPLTALYGARIIFSGYLAEGHRYNDDVIWGRIDAVVMTANEVKAEKERLCQRGVRPPSPERDASNVKKDILGFYPGMSKADFLSSRQSNGCGGLTAQFTEKLESNLVQEIDFRFESGTPPVEMIASISEQFGVQPTKSDWNAEIKYATQVHECPSNSLIERFGCVGGTIARWKLDNSITLVLTLNSPAAGTRPNDYILSLSSNAIAGLDKQAETDRRRDQELRARAINPNQKF
jgi:hypothetical protein